MHQLSQKEIDKALSRKEANAKYNSKRSLRPRLPGAYLTDEQNERLIRLASVIGTKQDAINEGLRLLEEKLIQGGRLARTGLLSVNEKEK
jgi:hypothetical protein